MTGPTKRVFLGALAALGLAIFLWAALKAPVVKWSDSEIDLGWAREGQGIFRPAAIVGHAAKPGYLLFLRAIMTIAPGAAERAIVIVHSLLVWAAIALASLLIARRSGYGCGVTAYLLLSLFLRLRDSCSAIMPEALSIALFLPIVTLLMDPPTRKGGWALLGIATAALFLVRPNVGAVALLLALASAAYSKKWRELPMYLLSFAILAAPFWIATRPPPDADPFRGLSYQVLEASADDYWRPVLGEWPAAQTSRARARDELSRARENWTRLLESGGADAHRQFVWRAFRGLLGSEYYDARWSVLYRRAAAASRWASPFLILAAVAILLAAPSRDRGLPVKVMGLFLLLLLVLENLVLGSNPRYVLSFLPGLFVLALVATATFERGRSNQLAAAIVFLLLIGLTRLNRSVLDSEWGKIDSAGVTLRQEIPRGALPRSEPATLHVRIAPALVPSNAQLIVRSGGQEIYTSVGESARDRPEISIRLKKDVLDRNVRSSIELELTSLGDYGPTSYLLFPVIPPSWSRPAHRAGSPALSPDTGISRGSLDWWAHSGSDNETAKPARN